MSRLAAALALTLMLSPLAGCIAHGDQPATSAHAPRAFAGTAVFPGHYDLKNSSHTLVNGTAKILDAKVVKVKSSLDGADIEIGYILPDVPGPVPVIAVATPYNSPLTAANVNTSGLGSLFVKDFVPHGYAYAVVSVRGTADSGGCMDFMGPSETHDTDEAVTWLGTQSWSDGNVALIGISYDGSTPWEPASLGNPHLKTIVPMEGINDYYQLDYRNGTATVFGLEEEETGYYVLPTAVGASEGKTPTNYVGQAACPESWKSAYAQFQAATLGDRDALGFWAARNLRPAILEHYRGSVLLVHGFWDDNVDPAQAYPFVDQLQARGVTVKHFLGQWKHELPGNKGSRPLAWRPDWNEILLHWFDHELKGDTSVDVGAMAEVQDSSLKWRSESTWPPTDATETMFYLTADDLLAQEPGGGTASKGVTMSLPGSMVSGSAPADAWYRPTGNVCGACPSFATPAFTHDFRFAGLPRFDLTVVPTGPGGYIAGTLFSQSADGRLDYLGMGGGIDLRFADGTETSRTVVPNQPIHAKLEFEPMDAVVPAGSKLVLVLHQGGYGDHVPPPDTFPVQVQVGGTASLMRLRTFERGPDAFFLPPGYEQ